MKKLLTIISLLSISWSTVASAGNELVTKCRLYNYPNAPIEIPAVGEQKFELNGIVVEVKETNGCTTECYTMKEIFVTKNGVTFSTNSVMPERGILFPSLSITENGNKQTVQCSLTAK